MKKNKPLDLSNMKEAAKDLRYLLSRGYGRTSALNLVGDKYLLDNEERHILFRAIYPPQDAEKRKNKLTSVEEIKDRVLAIDGYNQIIVVESMLNKLPIIDCDDGVLRDISGVFSNYKVTDVTYDAIELILDLLVKCFPRTTLFYFDQPISKSGELARTVRKRLAEYRLEGDAGAVKQPDREVLSKGDIVASSDGIIIDNANAVVDLAGHIVRKSKRKLIRI
ncbi:MAG: DUF434 domain-containing protein [Candidatus Hodarchaeota archaeon]